MRDGVSVRQHYEQAEKQGAYIPELHQRPPALYHIWKYFCELHSCRSIGMGVGAIMYTEIISWQSLFGIKLKHWEITAIKEIDNLFLKTSNSK